MSATILGVMRSRISGYHWSLRMIISISEAFEHLGEPPLEVLSGTSREAYRLVLFGELGHFDIIRTEERHSGSLALIVHRIRRGDPVVSWEEDLQKSQWYCLQAILTASAYWELPSEGTRIGIGGYSAQLEGQRGDKYHQVCRWCPRYEVDKEWFELPCSYLTDLAQLLVPDSDVAGSTFIQCRRAT